MSADLLDAPGPGYRQQTDRQIGGTIERLELVPRQPVYSVPPGAIEESFLRRHPELKRARDSWLSDRDTARQEAEMSKIVELDRLPEYPSRDFSAEFLSFQSEWRRLTESLPEFPSDNAFAAPLKLFGPTPTPLTGSTSVIRWNK